ncbi:tryptophan 2,3-dioxygenase family protein [Pendulispora albinea]|uniref:Tryptophan 2,3-dioxygenase family protein n=1 Tax=Pendulispora albinea TaxID=2741071 RepID=A0ABZ2M4F7_9BACT
MESISSKKAFRSARAETLNTALQAPLENRYLGRPVGAGLLDYEIYLRTSELRSLQSSPSDLVVPDEMLFQVTHQSQELWLKLAAFESVTLVEAIDTDDLWAACETLKRQVLVMRNLEHELGVISTLSPEAFLVIRKFLGNGSGLQSPGYFELLLGAESCNEALHQLLERRAAKLRDVYESPSRYRDLHHICELFLDWDAGFQLWLTAHFSLVRRTLGIDRTVKALDGFPTVALGPRTTKPLFPALWEIRVEMSRVWTREGGPTPGARPRSPSEGRAPSHPSVVASPLVACDEDSASGVRTGFRNRK